MTADGDDETLARPQGFDQVVLVTGHMTDSPTRPTARFPEHAVPAVARRIERSLLGWRLGAGDLLISGGARGADLIATSVARRLGATVWMLLAEQPDEFERHSVAGSTETWIDEFRASVADTPTWVLGDVHRRNESCGGKPDAVYVATNEWMLDVATRQAGGAPVRVLAVWDGLDGTGPGGAAHMVDAARRAGADVTIIDPGR